MGIAQCYPRIGNHAVAAEKNVIIIILQVQLRHGTCCGRYARWNVDRWRINHSSGRKRWASISFSPESLGRFSRMSDVEESICTSVEVTRTRPWQKIMMNYGRSSTLRRKGATSVENSLAHGSRRYLLLIHDLI
jgi:hypothetical protein